jgi:hypothetical protein
VITIPWKSTGEELKYDSGQPPVPEELSDEEKHNIKERMLALDKLLLEEGCAKYKIELMFGVGRDSTVRWKPVPGIMQFWESGRKEHGGGDVKLYFCPGKELIRQGSSDERRRDCEAFLGSSRSGFGFLPCTSCGQLWKAEEVLGEVICNLPMQKWAEVILHQYKRLGMNADIYIKFAKDDFRAAAMMEQQRQLRGEKLDPVRNNRPKGIYPLRNIIKDTTAGADLLKRFYAFLTV